MKELFESSYLSIMSEQNDKLRQELEKYKNNWEDLKKWVEYQYNHTTQQNNYYSVLNKMKELEEKNND